MEDSLKYIFILPYHEALNAILAIVDCVLNHSVKQERVAQVDEIQNGDW